MLTRTLLSAAVALLFACFLFAYTNRDSTELPDRTKAYRYVTNETQKLLDEAQKEAARVKAARTAAPQVGGDATTDALLQYGVALRDGDEGLAATIKYVHQYGRLAAAGQHQRDARATPEPSAASDHPPVRVHVFLAADNGTYSGMHELFYIAAAMRYSTRLHVAGCRSALFGFLEKPARNSTTGSRQHQKHAAHTDAAREVRKVPVLAVTTGIYVTSAAACTAAVMELPMFSVQSVTLIGTAGVSPVVGGGGWNPRVPPAGESVEASEVTTNPACQQHWAPGSEKVALGSVCVTYASLMQECGLCVEDNDLSSLCSRPRCWMRNSTTHFGPCAFRHPVSFFAEQMKGAMYGKPFPTPSATVREAMQVFWEANEAATDYVATTEDTKTRLGKRMRASTASSDPSANASEVVLSYNRLPPTEPILLHCAEVSTSQILAGPRSDVLCRQYTEEVFEGLYAAKDLSCVQAMEGMGVLHVLTREYPTLPVAIVRGGSNYDMFPLSRHVYRLKSAAIRGRRADGHWYVAWDQKEHYISDDEFHRYTRASYQYSIETASAVVLNYFLSAETVLPGM
ncbi:hypothetical protein LSCM4_00798 [Leishmania orientalis]|uniref:Uncharacterized protein n=1 Tax=Leishmania orientalis TaxID=2249476 RepID=A0A836K904_9TRYP|nr:hypothetical protein LSCM4_00798 [Leishmania orientalis]